MLAASDLELAPAAQPAGKDKPAPRRLSVIGIWDSGRDDLSERHDEIIRRMLKRPA